MGRNPQQVCLSCLHNCRFFHSHRTPTTSTSPNSFYKLIRPHTDDFNVLYLPPKLNHIMSTLIGKKINLEDSAGGRTVVTISKVDGSFAFKEGWDVFSKEHGLEIGDIVVFNFINKLNFDVKIYDESVCERLDFSKKRNGRKRDRSGKFVRQNCIENISENDNEDRRVRSKCTSEHIEDPCYITSYIYQNDDLAVFNKDPMLEEVLGTGDTSYASKLLLLGRNSYLGETDKSAYDDSSALIHGQNKEQKSIMFDREAQECQLVESLGSAEAAISKDESPSNALEVEIFGRNNSLVDSDKGVHDESPPLKLEENKKGKSIISQKEIEECQFAEGLGSDSEVIYGEWPNETRYLSDAQIHIGELNEVPINMTPKMCSFTDKLHATELPKFNQDNESRFETSGGNNSVGDSGKSGYAKTSTLKLEENIEGKFIMSEKEIQECLFAEGLGSDSAAEERCNKIRNFLNAQIHIGEMKEVPMNMTPKIGSFNFNDILHATELPKVVKGEFNQDIDRHFETAATVSSVVLTDNDRMNAKQEPNDTSNLLNDRIHFGEIKEVPMEMTPKLGSFNDKLNATGSPEVIEGEFNEAEAAETVTCEVLTNNHYLKLSLCLSLSRAGIGTKGMVVLLRDPLGRLWPVLCHKKTWLASGWLDFQRENNIKPGDVCVFRVVNKFERIISVHINHN
ncbi:unnamed protein product [Trifolium pratense]|uniref:Uncharacterized protein n=2 Tax=Trifolium pratense TaxID=57577 RepID=A0ACB0JH75_TRIPR|nr:unnamed protein product [Trifolium pratense]